MCPKGHHHWGRRDVKTQVQVELSLTSLIGFVNGNMVAKFVGGALHGVQTFVHYETIKREPKIKPNPDHPLEFLNLVQERK